jgi:hypothetical protein
MSRNGTKRNRLFVLNDPHAMRVSKELAKEIGLNQSIVLLQIDFLLAHTTFVREGLPWIRMTLDDMKSEYFDFWSRETLRRTIQDLEDRPLVRLANFNRRGFDRTQWITLDVDGCAKLSSLTITHFEQWGGSSAPSVNNPDGDSPITQNEQSQVNGQFPFDDPESLTAVDEQSPVPITQNEQWKTTNREMENPDRVIDDNNLGNASQQNEPTIGGRDLKKRLTSSGRDAEPRPTPKRINVGKLLSDALPAGRKFPRSFKGHLGREMHKLAKEGFGENDILAAAKACIDKGLNPHNLPSLVIEVRSAKRGPKNGFQTPDHSEYEEAVIR